MKCLTGKKCFIPEADAVICHRCRAAAMHIDELPGIQLGPRARFVLQHLAAEKWAALTAFGIDRQQQAKTYQVFARLRRSGLLSTSNRFDLKSNRRRKHWRLTALGHAVVRISQRLGWPRRVPWADQEELREAVLLSEEELKTWAQDIEARRASSIRRLGSVETEYASTKCARASPASS